ncbi:iron-sulfur cluster carrier protein ApbC [Marinobacterium sp. D7]|uniref:iron-sulfur cluster carrier protein ApbC n=1 Tax=Marinobacterium ramblicola TaxID=2849041 RepID=UPI001C2D4303|nr:iron-sulfur cluster carrier protein ApbC [Marinobacterium ramblicola]MBV1788598.1 iron-sulfur cluster carrier protein ApbC [Marinobacterium ramblicola]
MSELDRARIQGCIESWVDPVLEQSLGSVGAVKSVAIEGKRVSVALELPYACAHEHGTLKRALSASLAEVSAEAELELQITQKIAAHSGQHKLPGLEGVRNIIAVASGKGGVGKSTTTTNLALALKAQGARVGVLDADIYGPSQGMMLGVPSGTRPQTAEEKYFLPVESLGVQVMSMSFLVDDNTPMVWRGPMVSGALQQLLNQTRWDDLDYLLIDMPPGTGDIQLTLSQRVPVSGAVIVTTPQDIALLDACKGIEMFRKVDIPVLGVIENMSTHICSNCGHEEAIFGSGGGDRLAKDYQCELLGQMPLALAIREQADAGKPSVVADPEGPHAQRYLEIAAKLSARLAQRASQSSRIPNISIFGD